MFILIFFLLFLETSFGYAESAHINEENESIIHKEALKYIKYSEKNEIVKRDYPKAFELFSNAAKRGYAPSQFQLGLMYLNGLGIKKNDGRALYWLEEAANQNHRRAQYHLGVIYRKEKSVQNFQKAVYWYKKAAENNLLEAQNDLAHMYLKGLGVPQNTKLGIQTLKEAAQAGNAYAQFKLGILYFRGELIPKNEKEALYWLEKAAHQDFLKAQHHLGILYKKGESVQNFQKAVYWYKKAAENNLLEAQNDLAYMYLNGLGVPQNIKLGVQTLKESAQAGNAYAQFKMGSLYLKGEFIPKNEKEAFYWFEKAAKKNHHRAQYQLSEMYGKGIGVQKDIFQSIYLLKTLAAQADNAYAQFKLGLIYQNNAAVKNEQTALYWFEKAAKKNYPKALAQLAHIYLTGEMNVEKNMPKAFNLYLKAANRDHSPSQYMIGVMHEKGIGVEVSSQKALDWYKKAAENNFLKSYLKLAQIYNSKQEAVFAIYWLNKYREKGNLNSEEKEEIKNKIDQLENNVKKSIQSNKCASQISKNVKRIR